MLQWQASRFEDGTSCSVVFVKSGFWRDAWNSHPIISTLSTYICPVLSARYFYLSSGVSLGESQVGEFNVPY